MPTKTRPHPVPSTGRAPAARADGLDELAAKLASTQHELDVVYGQLERLNRLASIGTIASMIAHEFNNILTPIMSYSQMAAAAPDDRELTQKALARTLAGSERAAKIADAILNFVRDEGGGENDLFHLEQMGSQTAHVGSVVRDALSCLAKESGRDGVGTTVRVPESLTAAIHPIALQQVLVNLILNARNAMGSQGGSLDVFAALKQELPATPRGGVNSRCSESGTDVSSTWNIASGANQAWVCITVRDTGCGMSSEQLGRMFTPFDSHSLGEHRGTGLGMVITKRLVERTGGWMIVESSPGHGTITTIVLPAA